MIGLFFSPPFHTLSLSRLLLLLFALCRSQQTLADSRISLVHYVTKLLECKLFCQDHLKARHEQAADDVDAATVNQVCNPLCSQRRLDDRINSYCCQSPSQIIRSYPAHIDNKKFASILCFSHTVCPALLSCCFLDFYLWALDGGTVNQHVESTLHSIQKAWEELSDEIVEFAQFWCEQAI